MISDDFYQNSILHRPNSKSKPFLVPINDNQQIANKSTVMSRKSIRILRPETIKRAVNDACMAAAIGDLDWLKQTLKISTEKAFDKDGFSTIHLASIHGRLNIIKYLIEEQDYDPNLPSSVHCWYPIHLCISNQIGSRSIDCLKYLVDKGAQINVKNTDNITPLHMAASEGHVECLKLLLGLKADVYAVDIRGHSPLDLAKLWGHRTCAKLLDSHLWNLEKKEMEEKQKQENKLKVQEILKGIEQAHYTYYADKEESNKNFDLWLLNQGFDSKGEEKIIEKVTEKEIEPFNLGLPSLLLIPDEVYQEQKLMKSLSNDENLSNDSIKQQVKLSKRKWHNKKIHHPKDWNYSTKSKNSEYLPNLNDFFPRDPYTGLPANLDLVLLNRELKGMSLEEVKEFMKKNIKVEQLNNEKNTERTVYYKPKNIIDTQSKLRPDEDQKGIDQAGLFLGNDPKSFPFKQAKSYVMDKHGKSKKDHDSSYGAYNDTQETLKQIQKSLAIVKKVKDDKLEIVRKNYGNELSDFMTDKRHGKMSQKYEKVFIT